MDIQIIQHGKNWDIIDDKIELSKFNSPKSLDQFDINVFDFNNNDIWKYDDNSATSINLANELKHISLMIQNSTKATNIFILPQNHTFYCDFSKHQGYQCYEELKNLLPLISRIILLNIFRISDMDLLFENTKTLVNKVSMKSCFYFQSEFDCLTWSEKSNKCTTKQFGNSILTTLDIKSLDELYSFLKEIGLEDKEENAPEWMSDIFYFNDVELNNRISDNTEKIQQLNEEIQASESQLDRNNYFKSILYSNGDFLVEVIFSIFEELFDKGLDDFVDNKKEDFVIKLEDITFIGEIKGISSNVKSTNISQLDLHYHSFIERNDSDDKLVKPILIICHQRNIALSERQKVHIEQIKLAERNGSLIVETYTLLNMYQDFKNRVLNKEKTGILEYSSKR